MTSRLKNEDVIKLYKENATEAPSTEIDDTILNYAQTSSNSAISASYYFSNWKPILGLAASVVFITLLSPWKWIEGPGVILEDANPEDLYREELQLKLAPPLFNQNITEMHTESVSTFSESAPAASSKMLPSQELKRSGTMVADTVELDDQSSPFAHIEELVLKGEIDKAKKALKKLLQENPDLEKHLPEYLLELQKNE